MPPPPITSHPSLVAYAALARRELTVFGAPVEAVLVPGRKARAGIAGAARPAFAASRAGQILATEAFWRQDGLVLTPNRYPFAREHRLLWSAEPRREPSAAMWAALCGWAEACGGSAMVNTIGAAATMPRAHAHLTPERLDFLASLPVEPGPADLVELPPGVELVAARVPFCLLGVRGGDAAARAAVLVALAESRQVPCWNVAVQADEAWLYPRSTETPAPHFPYALGAAELWGRWCYVDAEPFEAATGEGLQRAMVAAGVAAQP